jgi:hypothetical protein
MLKTCLAQEIGQPATLMLAWIAHVEDAKSYRAPVLFFNEQLMAVAGFTRKETFIAARRRAIEAGWLHYEPGGKSRAGKYWVTIPDRFLGVDDLPTDESGDEFLGPNSDQKYPHSRSENGTGTVPETGLQIQNGAQKVPKTLPKADRKRTKNRTESVPHSSLYLSQENTPCPESSEDARSGPSPDLWGKPPIQLDPSKPTWVGISDRDRVAWAKAYPAADIDRELARAASWCISDPRRGRKSNYSRFLNSWLARCQDRGGSPAVVDPARRSPEAPRRKAADIVQAYTQAGSAGEETGRADHGG